jgi:hypothetical protein
MAIASTQFRRLLLQEQGTEEVHAATASGHTESTCNRCFARRSSYIQQEANGSSSRSREKHTRGRPAAQRHMLPWRWRRVQNARLGKGSSCVGLTMFLWCVCLPYALPVDGPGDVWYNVPASIVASQRPLRDRCFARACVMLCLQISNDEISVHADTLHYFSAHALRLP